MESSQEEDHDMMTTEAAATVATVIIPTDAITTDDGSDTVVTDVAAAVPQAPTAPTPTPIRNRFEEAKKEQQRLQEERLSRIKNTRSELTSSIQGSSTTSKRGVLKNAWENALTSSNSNHQQRVLANRRRTIDDYSIMLGSSGLVQKRIGEWEELFMQLTASTEQVEATVNAAMEKVRSFLANNVKKGANLVEQYQQQQRQRLGTGNNGTSRLKFKPAAVSNDSEALASDLDKTNPSQDTNPSSISSSSFSSTTTTALNLDDFDSFSGSEEPSMGLKHQKHTTTGDAVPESMQNQSVPEIIILGNTSIYLTSMLSEEAQALIDQLWISKSAAESKVTKKSSGGGEGGHLQLSVGVYGDSSNIPPPVTVVAIAMRAADGMGYLALTINSAKGPSAVDGLEDPLCYGVQKIALFPPQDSSLLVTGSQSVCLFERIFEVVPRDYVATESNQHSEVLSQVMEEEQEAGAIEVSEISNLDQQEDSKVDIDIDINVDTDDDDEGYDIVSGVDNLPEVLGMVDDNADAPRQSNLGQILSAHEVPASASSGPPGDEDVYNFGRNTSVAAIAPTKIIAPTTIISNSFKAGGSPGSSSPGNPLQAVGVVVGAGTLAPWTVEDERVDRLPDVAGNDISGFNILDIVSISCAVNGLVLNLRSGKSVAVTGTLKSHIVPSRLFVTGDKVFDWYRGPAASGWLQKWPMQSQAMGRSSRRFFILRNNLLSYHVEKPSSEVEATTEAMTIATGTVNTRNSLEITNNTVIKKKRNYLMQQCLVVETSKDILWIRAENSNEEDKWMREIERSIAHLSKKSVYQTKTCVESLWQHEAPGFTCVTVDVLEALAESRRLLNHSNTVISSTSKNKNKSNSSNNYYNSPDKGFAHAALFRYDVPVTTVLDNDKDVDIIANSFSKPRESFSLFGGGGGGGGAPRLRSSISSMLARPGTSTFSIGYKALTATYSLDIGSSDGDRRQYEILNLTGGSELKSDLTCMRLLFEDMVILGGSNGFLGVGTKGKLGFEHESGDYLKAVIFVNKLTAADLSTAGAHPPAAAVVQESMDNKWVGMSLDINSPHAVRVNTKLSFHNAHATITCIATAPALGIFAAGDNQGSLSLWKVNTDKRKVEEDSNDTAIDNNNNNNNRTPTIGSNNHSSSSSSSSNTGFGASILLSFVTVRDSLGGASRNRYEQIRNLQFVYEGQQTKLVVSSNERLLILLLTRNQVEEALNHGQQETSTESADSFDITHPPMGSTDVNDDSYVNESLDDSLMYSSDGNEFTSGHSGMNTTVHPHNSSKHTSLSSHHTDDNTSIVFKHYKSSSTDSNLDTTSFSSASTPILSTLNIAASGGGGGGGGTGYEALGLRPAASTSAGTQKSHDTTFSFVSWAILDQVPPRVQALYSVAMSQQFEPLFPGATTARVANRLYIWKLYYDIDEENHKVHRYEWTEDMINAALQNSKYI